MKKAVRLLSDEVKITRISNVYCTEPEGQNGQPLYLNCVIEIETDLDPETLKYGLLRRIEQDLGRIRTTKSMHRGRSISISSFMAT